MIELLVTLFIVLIVGGLIYAALTMLPLPPPFKTAAIIVLIAIVALAIIQASGWAGHPWRVRW